MGHLGARRCTRRAPPACTVGSASGRGYKPAGWVPPRRWSWPRSLAGSSGSPDRSGGDSSAGWPGASGADAPQLGVSSCSAGDATVPSRGRIVMTTDPRANAPAMLASGVVLGLILFLVAAIYGSFTIIQPGNVGVVFNRWSGALKTVGQGVAWRVPWVTQVQSYPVALRTYTMVQRGAEGSMRGDDSIDLPTKELQQKMAAQQQAQQADYELQRQQTLAKAKVAEAEGEAQSTLVKAKAQAEANNLLQQTLSPLLIQNKAIERWNGTLPQFTGGGAIPFLNLKDLGPDSHPAATGR